jgi:hypothetical protein
MCRCTRLLPLLLVAAGCADTTVLPLTPQETVIGKQQSVHGQIYLDFVLFEEKDAFTAVRSPNGRVVGQFDVHNSNQGHIHGTVTCFTIDGQRARIGGVVTQAKTAAFLEGLDAYWTVVDGGEGNGASDTASDINYGAPVGSALAHCAAEIIPPYAPQRRANIQINQ